MSKSGLFGVSLNISLVSREYQGRSLFRYHSSTLSAWRAISTLWCVNVKSQDGTTVMREREVTVPVKMRCLRTRLHDMSIRLGGHRRITFVPPRGPFVQKRTCAVIFMFST